ncbi:MAG: SDR family oxidoreductase [Candidatus Diapherotrites archaeon]|nr:SDR family oxidoreductase [Candidatus Diapherotrites archaeon]
MESVVVTGGSGFIGSHLCDLLLGKGHRVFCADNFCTGQKKNVAHLLENRNFSLIEHDIAVPLRLDEKIGKVFNLASPASPADFEKIPFEIIRTNTDGVRNMLEFAKKNNAVFLQASTSEVYGEPLEHPQRESYNGNVSMLGERACYDESKRLAETIVSLYRRKHGVDAKIIRIFNTYGPRMRENDGRVIPNFIPSALAGKPITVYGNGSQTRSFCYVSDLVAGIHAMMDSKAPGPVNLGNPQEITVKALAEKIVALTGSKSRIVFKPLPQDDPTRRKPDISLAKKALGWEPKVSLDDGLKKTIDYFAGR